MKITPISEIPFDSKNYPKNLVPIPLCIQLMEIGFDEPCIFSVYKLGDSPYSIGDVSFELEDVYFEGFPNTNYNNLSKRSYKSLSQFSVPDWDTVFEWFRKHDIYGNVVVDTTIAYECDYAGQSEYLTFEITDWLGDECYSFDYTYHSNYYDAQCALLREMVKIFIKNKENGNS